MTFRHTIEVRYGECDMQRVVFNPNYWVYCDDAIDRWMRGAIGEAFGSSDPNFAITSSGFDFMTKAVNGTWHSAVTFGDTVDIELSVSRWGTSSFDVHARLMVQNETRFEATITYVSVNVAANHADRRSVPIPDVVRNALDPH